MRGYYWGVVCVAWALSGSEHKGLPPRALWRGLLHTAVGSVPEFPDVLVQLIVQYVPYPQTYLIYKGDFISKGESISLKSFRFLIEGGTLRYIVGTAATPKKQTKTRMRRMRMRACQDYRAQSGRDAVLQRLCSADLSSIAMVSMFLGTNQRRMQKSDFVASCHKRIRIVHGTLYDLGTVISTINTRVSEVLRTPASSTQLTQVERSSLTKFLKRYEVAGVQMVRLLQEADPEKETIEFSQSQPKIPDGEQIFASMF
jgi:hypothetical protein